MEEHSSSRRNIHDHHRKSWGQFGFHILLTLELKKTKQKNPTKTPHHTTEISFAKEVQNTGPAADSSCVLHSSYLCRREAPHWGRKICEWKKEPPNPDGQFKMLAEPQHSALQQSLTAAVTPGHFRPERETALKHCQGITAPQN